MNVSLTPELERWVFEKVDGERYESASDVIREGLLLRQDQEAEQAARLAALQADVQGGLDQLDRGEGLDGEEVFETVLAGIGRAERGVGLEELPRDPLPSPAHGEELMNVSIPPELERWLSEKVDGERYKSASDVVCEGLLLLQAREAEQETRYAALKADIQEALDEVERGELVDGEEAMDRAYALIAQLEENAA